MNLEDFINVIRTLQERIQNNRQSLEQNESRTRYALIDPLLIALGWDLADPTVVIPEYTVGNAKRADYALLIGQGVAPPVLFIEAKALGKPLIEGLSQSIGYCLEEGVQYFAVTDGARWEIYDTHKPVPIAQKKLFGFSINDSPNEIVLNAVWLWRGNHTSGTPASSPAVPETPVGIAAQLVPSASPPAILQHAPGWTIITDVHPSSGDKAPSALRFPDGKEKEIRYWKEVLVEVAQWLALNGMLVASQCPIGRGYDRYIVHSQARHPNGRDFFEPRPILGNLIVETNISSRYSVEDTKFLLDKLGQSAAGFQMLMA